MMITIEFIPREDRHSYSDVIESISEAVFGDEEKINFMEEFLPINGRIPNPKVLRFSNYLHSHFKLLWAIRNNDEIVGFISIDDLPHFNAIGFGINVHFAKKGIVSAAWQLAKSFEKINYPLNAYTSQRNISANKFIERNGFTFECELDFQGEPSNKYVFHSINQKTKIMLSHTDFNAPLLTQGNFFHQRFGSFTQDQFDNYLATYHLDYLRYLFYMCIMGAQGDYPIDITFQEIEDAFKNNENNRSTKINKILIGEAPPTSYNNYFYNINSPWNNITGTPSIGQAWTSSIKNALFPGINFPNKTEFLKACAECGFLLTDLFPYPYNFGRTRNVISYNQACINAFSGQNPIGVISNLASINNYLSNQISIGFGMKSFGEIILNSATCNAEFQNFLLTQNAALTPEGNLNDGRLIPVLGTSQYLRICYQGGANNGGPMGPNAALMNQIGIGPV